MAHHLPEGRINWRLAVASSVWFVLVSPSLSFAQFDPHTAVSPWHPEKGTLSLTQENADNVLATVTAPGKQKYTEAEVNSAAGTPMTFRVDAACHPGTSGASQGPLSTITTSGVLRSIRIKGPMLLDYGDRRGTDSAKSLTINMLDDADIAANGFEPFYFAPGDAPGGLSAAQYLEREVGKKAIEACNDHLARIKSRNPDYSDSRAFMASQGAREINWPESWAKQSCRYQRIHVGEERSADIVLTELSTGDLNVVGRVECISPFSAPTAGSDDLTTEFAALSAWLRAEPKLYRGTCPTSVAFDGAIRTKGFGELDYVVLDQDNDVHDFGSIQVTKSGEQAIRFVVEIDKPDPGPAPGGLTTDDDGDGELGFVAQNQPGGGPGGIDPIDPNFDSGVEPNNVRSGWYKIVVVRPGQGRVESNEANYKVVCEEEDFQPDKLASRDGEPIVLEPIEAIPHCPGGTIRAGRCICPPSSSFAGGRCVPDTGIDVQTSALQMTGHRKGAISLVISALQMTGHRTGAIALTTSALQMTGHRRDAISMTTAALQMTGHGQEPPEDEPLGLAGEGPSKPLFPLPTPRPQPPEPFVAAVPSAPDPGTAKPKTPPKVIKAARTPQKDETPPAAGGGGKKRPAALLAPLLKRAFPPPRKQPASKRQLKQAAPAKVQIACVGGIVRGGRCVCRRNATLRRGRCVRN